MHVLSFVHTATPRRIPVPVGATISSASSSQSWSGWQSVSAEIVGAFTWKCVAFAQTSTVEQIRLVVASGATDSNVTPTSQSGAIEAQTRLADGLGSVISY
jgi:hypothetical protein